MNRIIKRAITGFAAGFALVLSFSTKANAEEMKPVSTDNVSASMTPAVPDTQPAPAQSQSKIETTAENLPVQSQTTDSSLVSQEPAEFTPVKTASGNDIQSNTASATVATDEHAEEPEKEAQLLDMQPQQQSVGALSEQVASMPVSGEVAALSTPVSDTGDSNAVTPTAPSSPEENAPTQAPAGVSVGNTTLGENGDDSGWNSQSGSGWRYDAASGSVTLVGCSSVDITARDTGISLNVAGINRIGTLYADGDVSITGTGIVLIDKIDMLEGTQLNLLTDIARYEDGSAALFLRQDDGSYLLINGSVAGVLDEEYTLPDGITLVIPEDGKLDMRVTHTVTRRTERYDFHTESYSETEEVFLDEHTLQNVNYGETIAVGAETYTEDERIVRHTEIDFSTPQLTVPANSILRIEQGGLLNMQAYHYKTSITDFAQNMSLLRIMGALELDGSIVSDKSIGNFELARINLGMGAGISGNGTITDAVVYVGTNESVSVNLDGKSAAAIYSGAGKKLDINALSPDIAVTFENNARLNRAVGEAGSRITFYGVDIEDRFDILDDITCDYRIGSGYIYRDGNLLNEVFPNARQRTAQRTDSNQYLIEVQSLASGEEIVFGSDNYNSAIPGFAYCSNALVLAGNSFGWQSDMMPLTDEIHWSDLFSSDKNGYLDIFYCDPATGKITAVQLCEDDPAVNITNAFLIRKVNASVRTNTGGGGSLTSTNTGNTGSGVLGGQNAGTLQGGKSLSILSGSRSNTPPSDGDTGNNGGGNSNTGDNGTGNSNTGNNDTGNTDNGNSGNDNTGDENGADAGNQPTPSDPDTDKIPDAKVGTAENARNLVTFVTGDNGHFTVTAEYDHMALKDLGGGSVPVSVRWTAPAGWSKNELYAVFKNQDGSLIAFRITFSSDGTLCFDTSVLGDFTIVCFPWSGECFTEEFYAALRNAL